jgi:hypothetical protein
MSNEQQSDEGTGRSALARDRHQAPSTVPSSLFSLDFFSPLAYGAYTWSSPRPPRRPGPPVMTMRR